MDGEGDFLSGILCPGGADYVTGLDEFQIADTQEHPSSYEVQASRSTKGGKRSKNFNKDEDEVLCYAWLAVSKDPIHGANQSRTTFWGKIEVYYEEHNKSGISRSESSIMHRFLAIQASVNKFCGYYDAILRRNQSGTTILDKVCNMC
jgi:hypothetical protein